MCRLLIALLVLNLFQVPTGYACSMDGAIVQPVCCCDVAASAACSEPKSKCSTFEMAGSDSGSCCSIILVSGIGSAGKTAAVTADLPPFIRPTIAAIPVLPRELAIVPLDAHSLSCHAPPIYLLTGRLRR